MKPEKYPLPWCDKTDEPYWKINWSLCDYRRGWRDWQAEKKMAEIIPVIDWLLERESL